MEEIQDLSQYQRRGRLKKGQRYARDVAEELGLKVYKYKGETIWKTYDGWRAGATYDDAVEGRRFTQRRESIGHKNSRLESLLKKEGERHRGLTHSSPEAAAESWAKKKAIIEYNQSRGLKPGDPEFLRIEHRIQLGNKDFWNSPQGLEIGRPDDGWNIIGTTQEQYNIKDALEKKLKGYPYVIDIDDYTGETTIVSFDNFDPYIKAGDQGEIVKAGSNLDEVATKYKGQALASRELDDFGDIMKHRDLEKSLGLKSSAKVDQQAFDAALNIKQDLLRQVGRAPVSGVTQRANTPLRNEITRTLSQPFRPDDPDYLGLGVWHDADTLEDSWVKISRELNTDSGTLLPDGKWLPAPDPTARTSIDIMSDIGQGKGEFADILNLKNKFHALKRSLPPGEYHLHADNLTKAKYYQRAFRDDPWITLSGEQGGQRVGREFVKYDTLKLTVPERADQFTEALAGKTPWQAQGVPQTDLSKDVGQIAKRYGMQASDVSALGTAMRRAGSVLPFVGAGLDAWDVQQRWEEAMNNPNKGFADWLDKVQLGLASATLGTSFWAEPANFILGMTNLGIDVARTFAEEEKREDFLRTMRAVGREGTRIARMAL